MDDQELKNKEREQADNKMIMDAFNHLLDTYLHSSHRRKVDIITKRSTSRARHTKACAGSRASHTSCILSLWLR